MNYRLLMRYGLQDECRHINTEILHQPLPPPRFMPISYLCMINTNIFTELISKKINTG